MSIVTMFSGSRCRADEVASAVARTLGYPLIDTQLIDKAAAQFGLARDSVQRAMHGEPSLFNSFTHERERCIAALKLALAELLQRDNCVYHGFASHLVPRTIRHVLRVCVIANHEYRVREAMEDEAIAEGKATKLVQREDEQRYRWVYLVTRRRAWEPQLYDMVVPMHERSVEEAAARICESARSPALETTADSRRAMDNFLLAARVNKELVDQGYHFQVTAEDGRVLIVLDREILLMGRLENRLEAIARTVEGVRDVEVRVDTSSQLQTPFGRFDAEPPVKVLLVDDEREFVETLSERLRVRELQPAVAYNGEEALAAVETDEPEVMILDLKMPGIDGMEVLRRIKKDRPNVEVIILTGHGSAEDERLARELGAFAYLEKPVDITLLTEVMKDAHRKIHESRDSEDREP